MEQYHLFLDLAVFGTLGLMGFIALWVTLERIFFFRNLDLKEYSHPELLKIDLTKNLTSLSIIGANSPYVGLLGTVIGILFTFYEIGQQDNLETSVIMIGLALALKATAAGIAVAIPSIMSYNGLLRKVDVLQGQYVAKTNQLKS